MNELIQPGSPRWQELVAQGVLNDANRNWFLGDAALEIAPISTVGSHDGAEANLRQYADEIGVNFESLNHYRKTAKAWPFGTRVPNASWKVHQMFMGRRQELIDAVDRGETVTVTRAHELLGQSTAARPTVSRGPAKKKLFDVGKNLGAVRAAIRTDPKIALGVAQALADAPPEVVTEVARKAARTMTGRGVEVAPEIRDASERVRLAEELREPTPFDHLAASVGQNAELAREGRLWVDKLRAQGPWGSDTAMASELQQIAFSLMDLIVHSNENQEITQ